MEPRRLERRPEARAFSVEALLQDVRAGRIRIPDFQRPLRWRASHVLELFDSVYRGFPVGVLALYRQPAGAARIHFGPVEVNAPAVPDTFFVVDGQQRIVALAGAMLHPEPRPQADIYAVWFDLVEERFVLSRGSEPPPHWIPLNAVADSFVLLHWLNAWPFRNQRPDLVQRAIALGQALREYQIPAYIVESSSDEVPRLMFKRLNRSGVKMREGEVFDALVSGGNEPRAIESACARLQTDTRFGRIDREWFRRCLKEIEGLDVGRAPAETAPGKIDPAAVPRAENALRHAIRFFQVDAGIPHLKLLPYPLPLVVLARFFAMHPSPSQRTRTLLARWVWRGALSGVHQNSTDGEVRKSSVAIDRDEFASVERLLQTVAGRIDPPSASASWSAGENGEMRLSALAIAHLEPRDPKTGAAFRVEDLQERLDRRGIGDAFIDVAGNKKAPAVVARRVLLSSRSRIERLLSAPVEVLRSHALDQEAADALRQGDVDTFTRRRAEILDRWFGRFFAGKVAADDGDRPPIAELIRRVNRQLSPT